MIDTEDLLVIPADDGVIKFILIYEIRIAGRDDGYELTPNRMLRKETVIRKLFEFRRIVVHVQDGNPNVSST